MSAFFYFGGSLVCDQLRIRKKGKKKSGFMGNHAVTKAPLGDFRFLFLQMHPSVGVYISEVNTIRVNSMNLYGQRQIIG